MMAMMSPLANHVDKETQHEIIVGTPSTEDASATVLLAEATADYCQQLAEMLKKKETLRSKHPRVHKVLSNPTEAEKEKDGLLPEERQKFQSVVEDNIRLRAVIQDVTEANKRWQKYNQERQTYMQKLMDTIRDLKRKIRDESSSGSDLAINPPEVAPEEFVLLQQKYEKALEENRRLQRELDDCRKKIAQLSSIVSKTKSDNGEHIELLEMQVRAHRDDWEAEREEKKNILKREEKMQEQLNEAKAKIKELQRELHRREFCLCHERNGAHTEPIIGSRHTYPAAVSYNIPPDSKLIPRSAGRRSPFYYPYHYEGFESELATDGASPTPSRRATESSGGSSSATNTKTRDSLVCPQCKMTFSSGSHRDFLEHFEICQKGASQ